MHKSLDSTRVYATVDIQCGTGSIEKVSRIRDKYNLKESYWSDREATGYKEK